MDHLLVFLYGTATVVLEGVCFFGFLILYGFYKKKVYAWCMVLYGAYWIDSLFLLMADFLPGFYIFYNSRLESEPLIRSALIVAYLLSYRMIIRHSLDMPVSRPELFAMTGLFLLIPLTTCFKLTPLTNFLYNSYTWLYMLAFLGAGARRCWRREKPFPRRRFLQIVLTAMLILGILAYGETLLWLRRDVYYAQLWLQTSGQHMIFTNLIAVLVDGAGLWYVLQSLTRLLRRPAPAAPTPSPQALEDFCAAFKLTAREAEILALLAGRQKNTEIADRLCISPGTVKTHIHNIFTKAEVNSREELFQKLSDGR